MRLPRLPLVAGYTAAVVAAVACGDSTGPGGSVTIALRADLTAPARIDTSASSLPSISCTIHLVATPSGRGSATWVTGTAEYFAGRDRTSPVHTETLSADDIASLFDTPTISAGTPAEATFDVAASIPFSIRLSLHYRAGESSDRIATTTVGCGPVPSGAGPTISSLVVTPSSGVIEIGDSLKIVYTAATPAGLWHTTVRVPLPCDDFVGEFNEGGATSKTRTVYVRLPTICPLGARITSVEVSTIDAGLAVTKRNTTIDLQIADLTPPKILLQSLTGDVFVGDTIRYNWWVSDNGNLRKLLWEVLGTSARDSMLAPFVTLQVAIPVRAEWAPSFQLRLYAEDAAGHGAEIVSPPGGMRVHQTVDRSIQRIPLPDSYWDFVIDEKRGLVYLVSAYHPLITVASLWAMQAVGTVTLPQIGTSFDLSPSGDSLLVTLTNGRNLAIVDLTRSERPVTQRELSILNANAIETATHVRTTANGHAIVNTSSVSAQPGVAPMVDVDLTTWEAKRLLLGTTLSPLTMLERSGNGRVLLVATPLENGRTFREYDVTTGILGPARFFGMPIGRASLDASGQRLAVGYEVFDATFTRISQSPRLTGDFTILTPDGETLWQGGPVNPFVRTRVADGTVIDRSPGINPGPPRFTRDGAKLLMLGINSLTVIDAR